MPDMNLAQAVLSAAIATLAALIAGACHGEPIELAWW